VKLPRLHILQTFVLKKSHTGDLHTGLSLGFEATGLESGADMVVTVKAVVDSCTEIVEVFSSMEVMVEVLLVPSDDDGNNENPSIVGGDNDEAITFTHITTMWRLVLKRYSNMHAQILVCYLNLHRFLISPYQWLIYQLSRLSVQL